MGPAPYLFLGGTYAPPPPSTGWGVAFLGPFLVPVPPAVVVAPAPAGGRDYTVLLAAVALLRATEAFAEVTWAEPLDERPLAADASSVANLEIDHDRTEEDPLWNSAVVERRLVLRLTLAVRDEDPRERADRLDRLVAVAANALQRVSLASLTQPARTRLDRGRRPRCGHPEARVELSLRCPYLLGPDHDHDET